MKHLALSIALAALAGCSGKSTEPPPAAEKAADEQPSPSTPAAEKPAEKPAAPPPAAARPDLPPPPKVTIPVLDAKGFGGIDGATKLEDAAIEAALPGFVIERFETEAEGTKYVNFGVAHGGERFAVIGLGHAAVAVNAVTPAVRDEKRIGLTSTYSQFKAAWPAAKCQFFELKEASDGTEPFKSVDCKLPEAPALWYRFDVTDLKHTGAAMPPEADIADRPLTTFTADYGG